MVVVITEDIGVVSVGTTGSFSIDVGDSQGGTPYNPSQYTAVNCTTSNLVASVDPDTSHILLSGNITPTSPGTFSAMIQFITLSPYEVYSVTITGSTSAPFNITIKMGGWDSFKYQVDSGAWVENNYSETTLQLFSGAVLNVDWVLSSEPTIIYCNEMTTSSSFPGTGSDSVTITGDETYYPASVMPTVRQIQVSVPNTATGCKCQIKISDTQIKTANTGQTVTMMVPNNRIVKVIATPASGYSFTGWYSGTSLISSDQEYMFTALADVSYTGKFEIATYTLRVYKNSRAIITVNGTTVTSSYLEVSLQGGSTFTIVATLTTDWYFDYWRGYATVSPSQIWEVLPEDPRITESGSTVTFTDTIEESVVYSIVLSNAPVIVVPLYVRNTYSNTVFPQMSKLTLISSPQTFHGLTIKNLEDD